MRHKTKDKGDLGVAKAIPNLLEHNIRCCLPLSEHLPFDLIAVMPDFTTLRRVQVKYRAAEKDNSIDLKFRAHYYNSKHIYTKPVNLEEIDCYAVYCPQTEVIYYLRVDEIPEAATSVTLRLGPPLNNWQTKVWLARNYTNPQRIANPCCVLPAAQRQMTELDELALSHVVAHLVADEIQPFMAVSQYLPFDLIGVLPDMKTLRRIRVGYATVQPNSYIDDYLIYLPEEKTVVCYEAAQLPSGYQR
jgi:hypothetical protein